MPENHQAECEGEAFMRQFRADSAAALVARIARKEMLTADELGTALKVSPEFISDAVASGRMFAVVGPDGNHYYPAFYADPSLEPRAVKWVSKALKNMPDASKYGFFTSASHVLGTTPLNALRAGRLAEVLRAAAGFAD